MPITKDKKKSIIESVNSLLEKAQSVAFVHFKGLPNKENEKLRDTLAANQSGFRVIKKTLLKRALDAQGYTGTMPALEGEIAIAYGTDPLAPAREIYEFAKTHKDQISLVGGIFEGAFVDQMGITNLATIPPVPVLRGMFVNVINSPIQGFVVALSKIAEKKS